MSNTEVNLPKPSAPDAGVKASLADVSKLVEPSFAACNADCVTASPAACEASAIPAFAVSDKASLPTSCTKASVPAEPSSSNALPKA